VLGDALLLSGSLAAVAGAVFFLSERTRSAAAATAAILPSAVAALASCRIGNRMKTNAETAQFQV
jgi:prolipoprotein diacylglyceryltransferase